MAAGVSLFYVTSVYIGFQGDRKASTEGKGKIRSVEKVGYQVEGSFGVSWAGVGSSGIGYQGVCGQQASDQSR